MHDAVTLHIDAPAETLFDLVANIENTGRFSPETFEAEWLDGASAPAVGVRFRGHVKRNGRGPVYWTTCRIVACERPREFAFAVEGGGRTVNTWRYTFEPVEGGTEVTESFQLAPSLPLRLYWLLAGWARGRTNREGMRATLEAIKAVAEGDSSR